MPDTFKRKKQQYNTRKPKATTTRKRNRKTINKRKTIQKSLQGKENKGQEA